MADQGFKGYNFPLKGIVTSLDDPANLNRIQVYIPNYHGKRDPSREGPSGSYPWAQVNTLIVPIEETSSDDEQQSSGNWFTGWLSGVANKIKRVFVGNDGKGFESIAPPEVDDVIWLIFEGGDIRCPVYFGTAALPKNAKDRVIVDTSGVGSGGSTFQGADGSLGYTYQFVGGSPVDMVISVIYGEKNYSKIYPGNATLSMTLGYVEASANIGDAARLLQNIYNKNPTLYRNNCNSHYGQYIDPFKNWKNQVVPDGSKLSNALKMILTSVTGREAQDEWSYQQISTYITSGRSCGVTDPTALTFYCDMYKSLGSIIESSVSSLNKKTLDDLYQLSKEYTSYNGYSAYLKIQELITQGMFVKVPTTTLDDGSYYQESGGGGTGSSTNYYLKWPVPSSHNVTQHFSSGHKGIDIKASANAQVLAAHDGHVATATRNNDYGNYIVLEWSTSTKTVYKHLNIMKVKQGDTVKQGSTIGAVGMTGNATGYHLHFEVIINDGYKDPEAMSYGSNSTATSGGSTSTGNVISETEIWNAIRALGYNKFATAAIMGNMQAESALRSNNVQDNSGYDDNWYTNAVDSGTYGNFVNDSIGYGLCQWTEPSRKQKLINYMRSKNVSISNGRAQINFMYLELVNDFPQVDAALVNATSIVNPSNMFLRIYENPEVKPYEYRQGLAQEILNRHS